MSSSQLTQTKMLSTTRTIILDGPFSMSRGGSISSPVIAFDTWGEINQDKSNVILIFTGMSPGPHAASNERDPSAGWWEDFLGSGKAIDSDKFFIICINSLGSCKGSTGPASINPITHEVYGLDFPDLSLQDIARSAHLAIHQMGIERINTLIGPSMGGMIAQAYLMEFPNTVDHFLSLSSATKASPFAIAIRSLQRESIYTDPAWNKGNYTDANHPVNGMRFARKLGVISYRSANEWKQRFARSRIPITEQKADQFHAEFQVESYLNAHADRFVGQFDPNSYLYLSRAMDWFDVGDYADGNAANAFQRSPLKSALCIGVKSDLLFPVAQQEELADALKKSCQSINFAPLDSIQGHDSFLVDSRQFTPVIKNYLDAIHLPLTGKQP